MKKFRNLLLATSLLLGAGLFALTTKSGENPEAVDASRKYHTTGMYEKVVDINRLEDGDKVIIVIWGNQVLSYFGGNPAYAMFPTDGVYRSSDGSLIGLEDSLATEFTLSYDSSTNQYQFNGTMEMTSSETYDVLLAHVPYDTPTGFDTIGYFGGDDRFGAYKNTSGNRSSTKTHWTLSYSGNDDENLTMTNVYTSSCARSYAIYRKVDTKSFYSNDYYATYRNYFVGEDLNLDNFYIEIMDGMSSQTEYLYYQDNPHMFYFTGNGKAAANQTEYTVKLRGLSNDFTFEINEPEVNPDYYYSYVTPGMFKDYRGTYLVVEQEEGTRYFNARFPEYDDEENESNSSACEINNERISNSGHVMMDNALIIDKVLINNKYEYVAKVYDRYGFADYYDNPYYNDEYPDYTRFISISDEYSESNILTIKENRNGGMTFGFTSKYGDFFGFSYYTGSENFFFETKDYYQNARLYKINKVDRFDENIASFISVFEKQTENCDATGNSRTVFDYHWEAIEREYNSLSPDVKGYIANVTYTHNAETPHTIEDIMDRYDFILGKYTDLKDFIDRKQVETWQNVSSLNDSSIYFANDLNNSVWPIAIIVVSVSSISLMGLIIIKKKKHIDKNRFEN